MDHPRPATPLALTAALAIWIAACGGSEPASGSGSDSTVTSVEAPAAGLPLGLPDYDPDVVPERLALLIGIDQYAPGSELPPLDGSVNDVRAVREMLVGRYAFPADDVLVLENEQATHERIVRAFDEWLLGRAGPDTEVVFWFSGHGSTVPDANDEESDQVDETLLAWDSRADGRRGAYDVVDDELSALLTALGQRSSRATVVTDCCHSGSLTRGGKEPKTRFAASGVEAFDEAGVSSFWPDDVALVSDEKLGSKAVAYTHIAACGPDQLAYEMRDSAHGALTYYLLNALETAQPHFTYRQLADEASVRVSTSFPRQTVWYEGQLDRPLFSGAFAPCPAGFAASLQSDTVLKLKTGPWSGLRVGSELIVHDALSFDPVGKAVVEAVAVTGARASFVADEGVELREGGALRALETSRPAGLDPLPVFVADEALAARLAELDNCEVLGEDGPERYSIALEDGRYALRTPEGLRTWLEASETGAGPERIGAAALALDESFHAELNYRALQLFAQVPNELPLEAVFVEPTEADRTKWESVKKPWADARLQASAQGAARAAGGEFAVVGNDPKQEHNDYNVVILKVTNPGPEPVHVTVISVAEDRSRNRIWPPPQGGADEALVRPGEDLRVPVVVVFDPKWNLERHMRDRYLVLATADYPNISFKNQGSRLRGSSDRWNPVAELALAGERTRSAGSRSVPLDPADLGLRVIDLLVGGEQ
jgi:uncharacterized caspase-like protein